MIDTFLVPAKTVVTAKGDGTPVDITAAGGRILLLMLRITRIVEQEALDVSVWGSGDGGNFGQKPLASFPQKFYTGEHPLLMDLSPHPEIRFLRAHWEALRWGRGSETPVFEFELSLKEVPQEILQEVGAPVK